MRAFLLGLLILLSTVPARAGSVVLQGPGVAQPIAVPPGWMVDGPARGDRVTLRRGAMVSMILTLTEDPVDRIEAHTWVQDLRRRLRTSASAQPRVADVRLGPVTVRTLRCGPALTFDMTTRLRDGSAPVWTRVVAVPLGGHAMVEVLLVGNTRSQAESELPALQAVLDSIQVPAGEDPRHGCCGRMLTVERDSSRGSE